MAVLPHLDIAHWAPRSHTDSGGWQAVELLDSGSVCSIKRTASGDAACWAGRAAPLCYEDVDSAGLVTHTSRHRQLDSSAE